jgi:hypothetical protein
LHYFGSKYEIQQHNQRLVLVLRAGVQKCFIHWVRLAYQLCWHNLYQQEDAMTCRREKFTCKNVPLTSYDRSGTESCPASTKSPISKISEGYPVLLHR